MEVVWYDLNGPPERVGGIPMVIGDAPNVGNTPSTE